MARSAARWTPAVVSAMVAAAALAACSSTEPTGASTTVAVSVQPGPNLAWSAVELPAGVEPKTLTTMADRLLVGGLKAGDTPETPSPVMLVLDAGDISQTVPLTPQSPYAPVARWYSVATDGTRIVAIGGANGGAHANVRWTTWSGTLAGVQELPQNFYTFGGWGAGDLVDAVITPGGDALVGSWGGAQAGLDAAVWTFANPVWTRQDPAGTALESTATLLVGPRGATSDGDGILVSGSALHLDDGVKQTAAVWRSSGVNTGWHRIDLPDSGIHSESVSAHCGGPSGAGCVVAGQVDGRLAVWSLDGDHATRQTGIPALAVGDQDVLPAPVIARSTSVITSPNGATAAVLSRSDTGSWAVSPGPAGLPVAAALVGDRLYVATRPAAGAAATLFVSRWSG
ncbi:MAG TPA: hypothetical protein VNC14_06440 [Lapillicoccus sp.]|nr:hypothetical protein [Lapillicoccus sp.]